MKIKYLLLVVSVLSVGLFTLSCSIESGNSKSITFSIVKGPVYDASFTDGDGNLIVPIVTDTYKYTFSPVPKYPVTVVSGNYDANHDGKIEIGVDYKLPIKLTISDGTNITPLTTYIAELTAEEKKIFLQNNNISEQELSQLSLATESSAKMVAINMAMFSALTKKEQLKTSNPDFNISKEFYKKLQEVKVYTDPLPLNEASKEADLEEVIIYLENTLSDALNVEKSDIDFTPIKTQTANTTTSDNVTNDNITSDNVTSDNITAK